MALTTVTVTTDSHVTAITDTHDDPIGDDATARPAVNTTYLIQHLIFIFGSFELVAALASSISISGDNHAQTTKIFDQQRKKLINNLFSPPNQSDVLDIRLGCVPVSVDADARKVRWTHWATLLPEIPGNTHFKIQGAIS
ncbi:MAG: hypothetical protein AAF984_11120 [Verrucomicrobiota bacterium]